jgi:hypothetical protein
MSESVVPFFVIGALLTLHVVAATWRWRDVARRLVEARRLAAAPARTPERNPAQIEPKSPRTENPL